MKTGFLQGPFVSNQELFKDSGTIFKIAIQSKPGHYVNLDGSAFEIGKTGMLQFRNSNISSVSFSQDEDSYANIAYLYN